MSAAAEVCPALIGHLKDLHLPTVRELLRRDGAAGGTGDVEL